MPAPARHRCTGRWSTTGELVPAALTDPEAGFSLYTVVYYIYEQLSAEWDLGRAAAASLLLFAAVLVLTLLQAVLQRTRRRRS